MTVGVPSLAGPPAEEIFAAAQPIPSPAGVALSRSGDLLLGCGCVEQAGRDLTAAAGDLYARVLGATRGLHLYRVWNYVPAINAATEGMENYRAFCRGRSLAFEADFGTAFPRELPAASAVGTDADRLSVLFVAGTVEPRHLENPEQVPAYLYPPEHGPRSPSFARATVVAQPGGEWVFVSGTAAIKGHVTIAPDRLDEQITCTLDNLRIIGRAAGIGEHLGAGGGAQRHFKIYLRHAGDLAAAQRRIEAELVTPEDRVIYVRADICRAALAVEIEVTLGPRWAPVAPRDRS